MAMICCNGCSGAMETAQRESRFTVWRDSSPDRHADAVIRSRSQQQRCFAVTCSRGDHADGYRRVVAVVKTARTLQLTSHPLISRIHNRDRGGICHQLANDGKVRWVK